MSRRPSAPYVDHLSDDGTELIYEGHDAQRAQGVEPKVVDQPWSLPSGKPTDNARFAAAIEQASPDQPPLVRVYEKLRDGIWSDRGLFHMTRYEYVVTERRKVFKFHMVLSDREDMPAGSHMTRALTQQRIIPSWVKQQVYKRDRGRCVLCGAQDQLHFDHDYPYSKGGTSATPENVRVLCARHNLEKSAKIQ